LGVFCQLLRVRWLCWCVYLRVFKFENLPYEATTGFEVIAYSLQKFHPKFKLKKRD